MCPSPATFLPHGPSSDLAALPMPHPMQCHRPTDVSLPHGTSLTRCPSRLTLFRSGFSIALLISRLPRPLLLYHEDHAATGKFAVIAADKYINITPLRGLSVTIKAARSSAARMCVVRLKTADLPEVSPSIPISREVNRACSVPLVSLTAIQPLLCYSELHSNLYMQSICTLYITKRSYMFPVDGLSRK